MFLVCMVRVAVQQCCGTGCVGCALQQVPEANVTELSLLPLSPCLLVALNV
jgi:hypothetical protein